MVYRDIRKSREESVNKTRIEFGTHAWNPVDGCLHDQSMCAVSKDCWARAMAKRFKRGDFKPAFHPELLEQPFTLRHPDVARILVCFTGDLGGLWVPKEWQGAVVNVIRICSRPKFLLLTKNPSWYAEFNPWPKNAWVGASAWDYASTQRALFHLSHVRAKVKWLSLEPVLGRIGPGPIPFSEVSWIVVGPQTGPGAFKPPAEWFEEIAGAARRRGIPLWEKTVLTRILKRPLIQKLPA